MPGMAVEVAGNADSKLFTVRSQGIGPSRPKVRTYPDRRSACKSVGDPDRCALLA
jgi:hypothetical protein